ncbi:MAG: hypothetical protein ACRDTD_32735 [Pseudonocardiaceae bacterium]
MAQYLPRSWRQVADPPTSSPATDLANFFAEVDASAATIALRNGIPRDQADEVERILRARIDETDSARVKATAQAALADYRRGADLFNGLQELSQANAPNVLGFSAQQDPERDSARPVRGAGSPG